MLPIYEITIILPSINPSRWLNLYNQLNKACGKYVFELIAVGPNFPDKELEKFLNFKYIREFSSPSRSFQIGVELSNGKYICFLPDDIVLDELSLEKCLDFIQNKPKNHGMALRYSEGGNNQDQNPDYWRGKFHGDQKLDGIQENWKIAPCFLYNREYFIEIGGLDCSLMHVNLNGHSVAYFTQANEGEIHLSPCRVFQAGWQPPTESNVLYQAYLQNDAPKFKAFWSNSDAVKEYKISFDNWKNADAYWKLRYG